MYNIHKGTDGRQKDLNNIKNPNKKNEIETDFFLLEFRILFHNKYGVEIWLMSHPILLKDPLSFFWKVEVFLLF